MPGDLRRPSAESAHVVGKLQYFSSRVEGIAVSSQRAPKLWVGDDRRVSDPVDRGEEVTHADGVQSAPCTGGEHAGIDLQVQMPMRIAGA
jgi:hypothetical protein